MLKINGTPIPTPGALSVGIQDLSKAERNARGTMIIERIATKRRLELMWRYLENDDLQTLLGLVSGTFFNVSYPDPQTGVERTGVFYCGDRKVSAYDYQDGKVRWVDVTFNLIER